MHTPQKFGAKSFPIEDLIYKEAMEGPTKEYCPSYSALWPHAPHSATHTITHSATLHSTPHNLAQRIGLLPLAFIYPGVTQDQLIGDHMPLVA